MTRAVFTWWCDRCGRMFRARGIESECAGCAGRPVIMATYGDRGYAQPTPLVKRPSV